MKANRLSTKKKVLRTSRRDARNAEKQENSRETITVLAIETAIGKIKRERMLSFFCFFLETQLILKLNGLHDIL